MRSALALLSAAVLLGSSACAGEDRRVASRLAECDLVTEGELGPSIDRAFYAPDACYRDCLTSASCEELESALCRSSLELLVRCDERCAFHCADGSLIGLEDVCDGFDTCSDGGDEEGCAAIPSAFTCTGTGGWSISGTWLLCNGWPECVDGSDERGCATFACADGREIVHQPGASPRCDGFWQCGSGSDEEGCARIEATCGP